MYYVIDIVIKGFFQFLLHIVIRTHVGQSEDYEL